MYNILLEGKKIRHWRQSNHSSATVIANGKIQKYWPVSVLVSSAEKLLALFVTVISKRLSRRSKFPFVWPSPVSANLYHTPFPTNSHLFLSLHNGRDGILHTSFTVLEPYWQTPPYLLRGGLYNTQLLYFVSLILFYQFFLLQPIMYHMVLFRTLPWTKWFRCNTQMHVEPHGTMLETLIMKSHWCIIEILCYLVTIAIWYNISLEIREAIRLLKIVLISLIIQYWLSPVLQYVVRLITNFVCNSCNKAEKKQKVIGGESIVDLFDETKQCFTSLTSTICPLLLTKKYFQFW